MKRALAALVLLLSPVVLSAQDLPNGHLAKLDGMLQPGIVTREANGIPHIFAFNRHDLCFLNGWLHAQDRLFQMDTSRRIASGTLAELLGSSALSNDVQFRTFGLRRAAEASLPTLSADTRAALDAYTQGVNGYLKAHADLPPEYTLLSITQFQPWTAVDSVVVGKLIAFGLSFDFDLDQSVALLSYQAAGQIVGFNGAALFANDTWRLQPFSSAATMPDATTAGATLPLKEGPAELDSTWVKPETIGLAASLLEKLRLIPALAATLDPDKHAGSNEWAIAGKNTTNGVPLIANDPHLALATPSTFYPISLHAGRTNVSGMGFPGAPFVIQGQNERAAWGSTVHPMDVTDIYQEAIVPDAASPSKLASIYKGAHENIIPIPETYRVNTPGTATPNNISVVPAAAGLPAATLIVPRHGPIVQIDTAKGTAVSVQYVGFYPTHELDAFNLLDDAHTPDQFKAALQFFDVGSQNWVYGDVDGNIAYFTSGEMPVREDLQAGKVAGLPPYFIRNGTGGNEWLAVAHPQPNQALPYEILPYAEMPQLLNPSNGWFVNANNDPTGNSLDNDPLNTNRPGGGIYYLNPSYDGFRAGRITQLVRSKLASGKMSFDDMKAIQADTVLLDAEVFVPYITKALSNAQAAGADPNLAALGASPAIVAAVGRLSKWDFSTPTGLAEGYDASRLRAPGTQPAQAQIDNSVAASVYAAWRSRFLANTIDGVLGALTMPLPPAQQALASMRYHLEHFATNGGKGASGISFFNVTGVTDAGVRRDLILLKSVADGLTMLSSDAFASAFNKSTNFSDYRWGKLHRVTFNHLMGPLFSVAAPYGKPPLPTVLGLSGLSVDGGFATVDAATHNVRATTPDGFAFGSGPNRRYVGELSPAAIRGQSSLPGGVSGYPGSALSTNLLMLWLVNDTYPVVTDTTPKIPWMPK
ncbi:MAG: penicillin acylase family protein [Acidobacteriota bacterium]